MNKWIKNFACKTTLSWWKFSLAGILALGIAFADNELAELAGCNEEPGGGTEV